MTPPPNEPIAQIIDRLKSDLVALATVTGENPLQVAARRRLDTELRDVVLRVNDLLRALDPIRQPRFIFDPGNPGVVGRFIALAMIAQTRSPLASVETERFYGSGIYALYYKGDFDAYAPLKDTETPIYVGKADPARDGAKTPLEQGDKLSGRLRDHLRNIRKATTTLRAEDFDCRSLVVQSGWQGAAEDYLIHMFKPIWNSETNICYGLGKHGDDPGTRGNLRSPWDTMHPGRDWAHRDPNMRDARAPDKIRADLAQHFAAVPVYSDIQTVLDSFIEELRQAER